ncbi:MAG TPA: hypothetical protein VFV50_13965 [Bdellovibrionales bacterium]|nr:hypothetical protein [Bdellovibrionales bacterium]
MSALRLDPSALPLNEKLVLAPQFRGANGNGVFSIARASGQTIISCHAQLGMLLFRNALNFEAKSIWNTEAGELQDFQEINHKSGMIRDSARGLAAAKSKFESELILDPLSALYALRQNPLRKEGDLRVGYCARGENPVVVEIFARGSKDKAVKAFGSAPRRLLKLELLIESPKYDRKVPVFQDGRTGLWIDLETNIPVEVSYEIPPIGALSMALESIDQR